MPIALPQLTGAHSSERIAGVVLKILQKFDINTRKVGYFVLDNASNNDSTILAISLKPGWSFNAIHRRLRCFPHTLNLIGQLLLWGKDADAFNSDGATSDLTEETQLMRDWRRDGPLGVLLGVIRYIKTPQQYALFEKFQRLAQRDLPTEQHEILEPVKPVVTRWNSYYSCFKRAVKLQAAVTAYANFYIKRVKNEDAFA